MRRPAEPSPPLRTTRPQRQPRQAEAEADRLAARAAGATPAAAPTNCTCGGSCPRCRPSPASSLPPAVQRVIGGAGQPLDEATRRSMEVRLNDDFGDVRLHADAAAAASARAVGALAYTVGRHIAFGAGQAVESPAGRRLLAHELVHVQQQRGASPMLQRKPDPQAAATPTKFYQAVADEIALQEADQARQLQEKKYSILVHQQLNYKPLKALLALAKAVDEARRDDIPALLDAFIAIDHGPPMRALQRDVLVAIVSRLFVLGLDAQGDQLRTHYGKQEARDSWIRSDSGLHARDIAIYRGMTEQVTAGADWSDNARARATMALYLRVLAPLRDEMFGMDTFERGHEAREGLRTGVEQTHGAARWRGLFDALRQLLTAMSAGLQALIDRAADELRSGQAAGAATLTTVRELVEQSITPEVLKTRKRTEPDGLNPPKVIEESLAWMRVDITSTEVTDGRGQLRDAFDRTRGVAVTTYTPGVSGVRELQTSVVDLFEQRVVQVAALARLYGQTDLLRQDRPAEARRRDDAGANARTLKALTAAGKTMRLNSDDDWREFVLQKYRDLTGAGGQGKGDALAAIMALLQDYLQAFTIHARFTNLYDQGSFTDAYFNRPFPKALSGQLVQDCGVYALRVAYILSLVATPLNLRVRFMRLPVHLGLIIDGTDLPTWFVHNNHFTSYSATNLAAMKQVWVDHGGNAKDDDAFLAEVSSGEFIQGPLDMPYRLSDARLGGADAKAVQRSLWTQYQRVAGQDVFGASTNKRGGASENFHNRYLGITERFREWHNRDFIPYWNETGPAHWQVLLTQLGTGGRKTLKGAVLAPLLAAYLAELDADLAPMKRGLELIHADEQAIGRQLKDDRQLVAPGARIASGERAWSLWSYFTDQYRARVAAELARVQAAPDGDHDIAALTAASGPLAPPFVPTAEKRMAPAD